MQILQTKITELGWTGSGLSLRADRLPAKAASPGQYYLAYAPGQQEVLATAVYPWLDQDGHTWLCGNLPAYWIPGMALNLRGPLGQGFSLPALAQRVALIQFNGAIYRLLPLIHLALKQNADVVCYLQEFAPGLPEDLEILPMDSLAEVWTWTDYVAVSVSNQNLPRLRETLLLAPGRLPQVPVEVLVDTPVACGGMAACGVCAVQGRGGWKLACKDGPVFQFEDLEV